MSGRHPHNALTARTVSATTTPGRYADGGGLYLLVGPSGSKSWVLRTLVHGKRTDIGLGSVAFVSLAEGRAEAQRLRRIARKGEDPLAARRHASRPVPTFHDAATAVHAAHAATFKNAKHRKQWLSSLGDVFAAFGAKRVNAITSADILTALGPTWLTRPETSRRILRRIRAVLAWCRAQGFCEGDSPTEGLTAVLPRQRVSNRHHASLPYPQLPAFICALRESEAGEVVTLALEFTIVCAARTSETLHATWAEVDLGAQTWTIPSARMKSGREHRVPLSPRAVTILSRAQTLADGGPYVFPSRSPQKPLSNMAFLMTLRRMGRRDITTHGFRSTFKDWCSERTNTPNAVSEAALAHTIKDKVEAAYHRSDLFEKRRGLMVTWARYVTSTPGAVVAIRA